MNEKIFIYKAKSKNIRGISLLFDRYRVFYGKESDEDLAFCFLNKRLKNKESIIFFAMNSENEYIGFSQIYPSFSSVSAGNVWILNDLYVVEAFRNIGVGKKLLSFIKEHSINYDIKGILLETSNDNVIAQQLYEKNGFKKQVGFYNYYLELTDN